MQDLNDKITGDTLTAAEFVEIPSEIQNVIEALGQTLSSGDLNQLGKSMAGYVANSIFYTDSGIADAYVLNKIGSKQTATAYTDGFRASFLAGNNGTGAATVNVAALGVKNIKLEDGSDPAKGDITGLVDLIFDSANDRFEILNPKVTGKVFEFNILQELIDAAFLISGMKARILGRTAIGDKGEASYEIKTLSEFGGTPDEKGDLTLTNGNVAELIRSDEMNAKAYGMVSGVDSTAALIAAVNDPKVFFLNITEAIPTWKSAAITRDDLAVFIVNTAIRVVENPLPIADRGMFSADGQNNLTIIGDFDLKGEGTRQIGAGGLVDNAYGTTAGRTGIIGPANSAVFFLRCSDIELGGSAKNTGESAYVLRNCGGRIDIDVDTENCGQLGVELNYPTAAGDGSSAPMPDRNGPTTVLCNGKHINDLRLGAGNGVVVGMQGATPDVLRNFDITVSCEKCARGIHQEFNGGGSIEGFKHHIDSEFTLQGDVTVQGKFGSVTGSTKNAGTAGAGAVNTGYPRLYSYVGSDDADEVSVNMKVISTQDDGFTLGTDGAIDVDTAIFTSASANFPTSIAGKHIVIEGANPSGSPLEAFVLTRDSATQLTLDLDAQVSVTGATYGFGSGLRNPMGHTSPTGNSDFSGSTVIGGVFSGLPGEPDAVAVSFFRGDTVGRAFDMVILAPGLIGTATAPAGMENNSNVSAPVMEGHNIITGFVDKYIGFTNQNSVRFPANKTDGTVFSPSATINTFGADVEVIGRLLTFTHIPFIRIPFDNISGETITVEIEAVYIGGGTDKITLTKSSSGDIDVTAGDMIALHRNNNKMTKVQFRCKSSIAASGASCRIKMLAAEG